MKKLIIILVTLFILPGSLSAGNLRFGITSAVKDTIQEAREKRDQDREREDKTPQVTLISPITAAFISGTFTLIAEANDDKGIIKVEFYINGALKSTDFAFPYTYSWDTTHYSNGHYTITAIAYDTAEHTATSSIALSVRNDSAPSVKITAPDDGARISGIVTVTISPDDDQGISKVELWIDNSLINTFRNAPFVYSWDTTQYTNSTHILKAIVYDTNNQTANSQHTVIIDNPIDNPPIVTITSPAAGAILSGTINITAEATDDLMVTKVEFDINGTKIEDLTAPYSYAWDTTLSSNGSYVLKATAYDAKNQTATAQVNVIVNNDFAPKVSITAPIAGETVSGSVNIAANATDDQEVSKVEFYINNVKVGEYTTAPYTYTWDTTLLSNGNYTISVIAYDNATPGNTGTAQHSVTVTNDFAPKVSITSPADGATIANSVNITATAADDFGVTKVEFDINGTKIEDFTEPYSYTWDTTLSSNGSYVLKATAYDAKNQTATAQVNVTVNNDVTPPTITSFAPTIGATVSGIETITVTATDDVAMSKVEFYIDDNTMPLAVDISTGPAYSAVWDTTQESNGSHTINAIAYDTSNQQTTASRAVMVSNDLLPTIIITTPTIGATLSGIETIMATATDDVGMSRVEFYIDNNTIPLAVDVSTGPAYSAVWDTTQETNGSHTINAIAYDTSNQQVTAQCIITVNN